MTLHKRLFIITKLYNIRMENRYIVANLSFKALQINYLTIILFLDPE